MLTPQPDPIPGGISVTDFVLMHLDAGTLVGELLMQRRQQGIARYGHELQCHNGRDPLVDALQEALDLCLYLAQEHAEWHVDGFPKRRLSLAFSLLHDIAHELENRE